MAQPIKNAEEHIASLGDDRSVFIDGAPAGDVTDHAAFRNSIRTAASLLRLSGGPGQRRSYDVRIADQWAPGQPRLANARIPSNMLDV